MTRVPCNRAVSLILDTKCCFKPSIEVQKIRYCSQTIVIVGFHHRSSLAAARVRGGNISKEKGVGSAIDTAKVIACLPRTHRRKRAPEIELDQAARARAQQIGDGACAQLLAVVLCRISKNRPRRCRRRRRRRRRRLVAGIDEVIEQIQIRDARESRSDRRTQRDRAGGANRGWSSVPERAEVGIITQRGGQSDGAGGINPIATQTEPSQTRIGAQRVAECQCRTNQQWAMIICGEKYYCPRRNMALALSARTHDYRFDCN